jgi:poly(3-hydroxybutyrate) depolymerase
MYSAKERIDIWSTFNKCGKPVFTDHGTYTSTHYGCDNSKEIELVTLKGVGHNLGEWAPVTDEMLIHFLLKQRK